MFGSFSGGSGSPLEARSSAPILFIVLVLAIISLLLVLIYLIAAKVTNYHNSDEYREKEINRLTKYSDVVTFCKTNNFSQTEAKILWDICTVTQALNINYLLKTNKDVNELFKNAYKIMKEKKMFTDKSLNAFFVCLFKVEMLVAQFKKLSSTRQITENSVIFYITEEGEQYPFQIVKNTKDFFVAEIPDFLANTPRKPKTLIRSRFTFKTSDGLSYNLISRIIRYEETAEKKTHMIIAHTDQIECQSQRHYKREFFEEICLFAPVKIDKSKKQDEQYVESPKKYKGKLTNISAGGCCINTTLPIKEKQLIGITLPEHGISETIIGTIKRTRKLPNQTFALHIQFIKLSQKVQNQIYTFVYKFEI